MCLSHLIYTVRPCLIHTCHAMTMPCSDHAVFSRPQHGRRETAVLCCGLEKNGMVGAWHGHGMASVNQTRPLCMNQMGKTHSKPLAARHGRGMGTSCYMWIGLNRAICLGLCRDICAEFLSSFCLRVAYHSCSSRFYRQVVVTSRNNMSFRCSYKF